MIFLSTQLTTPPLRFARYWRRFPMTAELHRLDDLRDAPQARKHAFERTARAIDNGGGGGNDGGMEARLAALEAANLETRDRLTRIETRLDATATRSDLADLKGDLVGLKGEMQAALHGEINAQTWRLVTFVCSFGTALVGATYFVAKYVH
jgi:hypothetical protein